MNRVHISGQQQDDEIHAVAGCDQIPGRPPTSRIVFQGDG